MNRMLSGWKQKKGGHRSANGFSLVPALLCLMFTAAVCAACTARMDAWIWLKRAQDRSVWELSVIDQAKAFWHEGQTMKLCDRKQPESLRQVQIQEDTVELEYQDTAIRCTGKYGTLVLFMDSTGISAVQWE
ncbi:hypothetical protein [Faecalibaculum rodentium]|uniref:hypothetical protein n=2 Tax=Faecalibaculum rodentium TaxID=1702221 RepID=UPI00256EBB9F|nr:hypothetical protein [Faecalibaculum rodentium]